LKDAIKEQEKQTEDLQNEVEDKVRESTLMPRFSIHYIYVSL